MNEKPYDGDQQLIDLSDKVKQAREEVLSTTKSSTRRLKLNRLIDEIISNASQLVALGIAKEMHKNPNMFKEKK